MAVKKKYFIAKVALKALVFVFLAQALGAQEVKSEAADLSERNLIRDRVVSSMFFRGELADLIIDEGVSARVLSGIAGSSYSETREALLKWAASNPEQAADLYIQLKRGGARPVERREIRYIERRWELTPEFLDRVESLKFYSRESDIGLEDAHMGMRGFFDGEPPELAARSYERGTISGEGRTAGDVRRPEPLVYSDYRIDRKALEKEIALAEGWERQIRSAYGKLPRAREAEQGLLIGRYIEKISGFLSYCRGISQRKALSASESGTLEKMRTQVRVAKNGALLAVMSGILLSWEEGFPAQSRGEVRIRQLKEELLFLARMGSSGIDDPLTYKNYAELEKKFAVLSETYKKRETYRRAAEKTFGSGFSCLCDFLFYKFLERFSPGSPYVLAVKALEKMGPEFLAVSDNAFRLPMPSDEEMSSDMRAASAMLALKGSGAERARIMQFIVFDAMFRPVKLVYNAGGGIRGFRPVFSLIP